MNEQQSVTDRDPVAQWIFNCKDESENARRNRSTANRENFECYHLRQDFSHKRRGQSKEFLAKQAMAVEQLCAFLQQGLMDLGDWFRVEPADGISFDDAQPAQSELKVYPKEIQRLVNRALNQNLFPNFFHDSLKNGLLGSLMIVKVGGTMLERAKYQARPSKDLAGTQRTKLIRIAKKYWRLNLNLIRHEDWFPDPTGDGLYEGERIELDWHKLLKIAQENPTEFDVEAVMRMQTSDDDLQKAKKSRETGQNVSYPQFRRRVAVYEWWGTILDPQGKVLHENAVAAVDTQGNVIRRPTKNPNWHQESPYVVSPIIRVPKSVWHKALMDAPTKNNQAMNELYNLSVDGAMMDVHGIKQLHTSWLEDPTQVSDGIPPGVTLLVNSQCPAGMKALERVDTSSLTPEAMNMFNVMDREFQQSALTNDSRMGNLPQRAVKATEIVASNQSLTGILNGIVKIIEEEFVEPIIRKAWLTIAQHANDLDEREVSALIGAPRAKALSAMSKEELFSETYGNYKYKVFGLSTTLNKIQDFRKITALLQSIGTSPQMMQEFTRKYSMTKLLGEIARSLDINTDKITATPEELRQREAEMKMQAAAMAAGQAADGAGNPQAQIPQVASGSAEAGGGMESVRGANNIGMTQP